MRFGHRLLRWRKGFLVGSVGFVVHESSAVLVACHRYRRIPWGPPGGLLERGEQPVGALVRELKEELDWSTSVEDWMLLDVCAAPVFPLVEVAFVHRTLWASTTPDLPLPDPSPEIKALCWFWPEATRTERTGSPEGVVLLERHKELAVLALRHFGLSTKTS